MDDSTAKAPHFAAYVALACVYFFWGTTYLAIRIAVETTPPVLLVAIRYTISGLIMLIAARVMKLHIPSGAEFRRTALCGFGTLAIGNGCLSIAEQWIPGGLAALFITTSPFWTLGVDALVPGGERFHPRTLWGMLIGLGGVVLLLAPGGAAGQVSSSIALVAFLVLQLGNAGWAVGSIYQKRYPSEAHPVVSGAVQQMVTGLVMWIPALILNRNDFHFTWRGTMAILYLVTFGSIIGYSAFLYAFDKLPVALVSTYTYVNPIVACVLGWLLLNEPFGPREMAAMAVIFVGIAVVRHLQKRQPVAVT